ncbi:MAG: hypothetical protein J7L15_01880, partial [Clostridiales bacterium]|nr:hypothetical protein [Clostridiales bacterium]
SVRVDLQLVSNLVILSHVISSYFILQVKSYIPNNENTGGRNVFEYFSQKIAVSFINPWEIELTNLENKNVYQRCFYYITDPDTKLKSHRSSEEKFNGVYMRSSSPFIARVQVKYKGEAVKSGSVNVAVWDAKMDGLCKCAGEKDCTPYKGDKKIKSELVLPPEDIMSLEYVYEDQVINGETVSVPISYVDIPLYSTNVPHAVRLYVKGFYSGFSALKDMYILFQIILKIDVTANAPITNGSDIAEQQSTTYFINPDYPNDETLRTIPEDNTVVQWDIVAMSRIEYRNYDFKVLDTIDRNLYSLDNVPISNGTYSYTRSGTSKNVFLGPVVKEKENIIETHEIIATVVSEGLISTDKSVVSLRHGIKSLDPFNSKFLMEMEYSFHDAVINKLWTDGQDYKKLYISRNPYTAKHPDKGGDFISADIFNECATELGAELLELNPNGQIVQIYSGDEEVEILHGDWEEGVDPYTGDNILIQGEEGCIDNGSAFVELNKESSSYVSDTTVVYIRANKFNTSWRRCSANTATCDKERQVNLDCFNMSECTAPVPGGHLYLHGLTTLFINGSSKELNGGGDMETGIPPCPICFREPLTMLAISQKVDGVETERLNELTWESEIDLKVEIRFKGDVVPNDTPVYIRIENSVQGFSTLFRATQNVALTYVEDVNGVLRSYADFSLYGSRIQLGEVVEKVYISCDYDEIKKTDRYVYEQYTLVTLPIVDPSPPNPSDDDPSADPEKIPEIVDVYSKDLARYNIFEKTWDYGNNMSQGRGDFFTASIGNTMYVIGGLLNNLKDIRSISSMNEKYDMSADSWETVAGIPTPRFGGMTEVFGNNIYTIGGIQISDENEFLISKKIEVYNTDENTWDTLTGMPTDYGVAFGTSQCVEVIIGSEVKNCIYIMCGVSELKNVSFDPEIADYNKYVLRYCIEDNEWGFSEIAINDSGVELYQRESPLSIIHEGKIIIFNGAWPNSRITYEYPETEIIY